MKHTLEKLFNPTSIAVIGASDRPNSVGKKVFKNLVNGNYIGELYPVNPKHLLIQGMRCFASVNDIKSSIDLAIITTPAKTVPNIMMQCGEQGIKAAIVISAGFSETGEQGKTLENTTLEVSRRYHINWIGPNCLGMMRSSLNLNATFDNSSAAPGHIALVSQSGALCAAILDWAANRQIGFSTVLSIGNSADIGFGEVLDYLANDPNTKSILLYIEGVSNSENFMQGLRAAASVKPVIAIKGGKNPQGSRAAQSHTGALVGNDAVFDAALRRCGAIRVVTIEQLFSAAEILSSNYRVQGNRLAIITNGGGAGVMAADRAAELNIQLPLLNENIIAELNNVLPSQWSHQNPIDIIGDATPERYHHALDICKKDNNFDALLVALVPIAMTKPYRVAKQIITDTTKSNKPILACWMGEKQVKTAWKLFSKYNIPCFNTPEKAIEAFSYLAKYYLNQQFLSEAEVCELIQPKPDTTKAHKIIANVLDEGRKTLTTVESKIILQTFSIPTSDTITTQSAAEAVKIANSLGYPVVMKINSPDITHKQDVGGVKLNIQNAEMVGLTFSEIMTNVNKAFPQAKILGITVEPMYQNSNNRELMIGVIKDKVFGSAISFGIGGSLVEIIKDYAITLPPINRFIATQLIANTRIAKALAEFRGKPPVNLDSLINVLVRVSNLVCALPQIKEMDINPLIANDKEIIALDARIML